MLTRGSRGRHLTVVAFGFICLCVLMQMLGTTMSLWDLEFELDPVEGPLLEGFSLPVSPANLRPSTVVASLSEASVNFRRLLPDHTVFHPPIPLA